MAKADEKEPVSRNTRPRRGVWSIVFGRGAVALLLLLAQFGFLFVLFGRLQQYSIYLSGAVSVLSVVFLIYLQHPLQPQ